MRLLFVIIVLSWEKNDENQPNHDYHGKPPHFQFSTTLQSDNTHHVPNVMMEFMNLIFEKFAYDEERGQGCACDVNTMGSINKKEFGK